MVLHNTARKQETAGERQRRILVTRSRLPRLCSLRRLAIAGRHLSNLGSCFEPPVPNAAVPILISGGAVVVVRGRTKFTTTAVVFCSRGPGPLRAGCVCNLQSGGNARGSELFGITDSRSY